VTLLFADMTGALHPELHGRFVTAGPGELWVEVAGAHGPLVVLLAGSDAPGFFWPDSFVAALVADGFRVARPDYRDCGRSVRITDPQGYRLADLADDVVAILDDLGAAQAHLVGFSLGAMVSQVLALDHPTRVASLVLVGGTPGAGDDRLSDPDEAFVERIVTRHLDGPPTDEAGAVRWQVELAELLAGRAYAFDRQAAHRNAERIVAGGWTAASGHGAAIHESPSRVDRLGEIHHPTLIVHGTEDPVYPVDHARALAAGIEGSILLEFDGLGHELPEPLLAVLRPAFSEHLSAARPDSGS
jgi:pimeloyl-ACP methyl ester carboxylesterase